MKELCFDTGLVTYDLNGAVQVAFNPTDSAFVERLFRTFDALDQKQQAYQGQLESAKDSRAIFDTARRWDAEMRTMLDELFGQSVCEPLFGGMNVYARGDGLPAWANLLLAVMDEIDAAFTQERASASPRLQKYLDKYQARTEK